MGRNPEIATPGCYIVIVRQGGQGQGSRPRWYFEICSHYHPLSYFSISIFFLLNTYLWKYFIVETKKSFPPTVKLVFNMLLKPRYCSSSLKKVILKINTDFHTFKSRFFRIHISCTV